MREIDTASEQLFWDERFCFFQAQGKSAEYSGEEADKALSARRGHPIIPPSLVEELRETIADKDARCEQFEEVCEKLRLERGRAQGEAYTATNDLRKVTERKNWLEVECGTLRNTMESYRDRERLAPKQPTEKLGSPVTVWDIYLAMRNPDSIWTGIRLLLGKWGVPLDGLVGSEFWSDTTGIKSTDEYSGDDSDTRRRLRRFLETGIYLKQERIGNGGPYVTPDELAAIEAQNK